MAYVCGAPKLKLKDRIAVKGDPVPEAAEWSESVRRAHLDSGAIVRVPDDEVQSKPLPQKEVAKILDEASDEADTSKGQNKKKKRR